MVYIIKWVSFLVFLTICACTDIKGYRILNKICLLFGILGIVLNGILLGTNVFYNIVGMIVIFFLGILPLMGIGDVKLWMVICSYVSLYNSIKIMGGATAFLCLYAFIKNPKESYEILRFTCHDLIYSHKFRVLKQTGYPLAPFCFLAGSIYVILLI